LRGGSQMKVKKDKVSWVERKLTDPKFKEGFEKEVQALSIGEQLAQLRIHSGLTQNEVGKRVGTSASAISRYESAEYDRYELKTIEKIVKACGGVLELSMKPGVKARFG
jgi:DNA-binding XRE family transcriptional regulator